MNSSYKSIQALAEAFGVELQFTDNWGRNFNTPPSVVRRILETKGIRIDPTLLDTTRQVMTFALGSIPREIPLYIDVSGSFPEELRKNSAIKLSRKDSDAAISSRPVSEFDPPVDFDKETGMLLIPLTLPENLKTGDHELLVTLETEKSQFSTELNVIVCPPKAYTPLRIEEGQKIAGIAVSLYGVRSETNWGVGDFSDLKRIVDWAIEDLGVNFVGLNPLHALFNTRPYNCSPYMPSSRAFYNFIYADITRAAYHISEKFGEKISSDRDIAAAARELRGSDQVDYEGVSSLKIKAFRLVFDQFQDSVGSSLTQGAHHEFERYRDQQGQSLHRFATFCVLRDFFLGKSPDLRSWTTWPESFQDPESDEVLKFSEENSREILFHEFMQWVCESQLAEVQQHALRKGMMIGLYHDLALAVDPDGADSWSAQDYFVKGFKVGAPPDAFAPEGQDWGFQPPDSQKVLMSGFSPIRNSLRAGSKYGGALRIDHVMQIHHLFWIPSEKSASHGVYVKDREKDLFNVLTLESMENQTILIGEDLGTLPFNFRERLIDRGIYSYRIFYFERDENYNQIPFFRYPERALVSLSTHDLPTFSGFWQGLDIDERLATGRVNPDQEIAARSERTTQKAKIIERLVSDGVLPAHVAHRAWESKEPTEELHTAVLRFVMKTPCRLALIGIEDLFLDIRQQNLPGTTTERPNWVTKTKYTIEELKSHPEAVRIAQKFRIILKDSDRLVRSTA